MSEGMDLTDEQRMDLGGSVDLVVSKGGEVLESLLPELRRLVGTAAGGPGR